MVLYCFDSLVLEAKTAITHVFRENSVQFDLREDYVVTQLYSRRQMTNGRIIKQIRQKNDKCLRGSCQASCQYLLPCEYSLTPLWLLNRSILWIYSMDYCWVCPSWIDAHRILLLFTANTPPRRWVTVKTSSCRIETSSYAFTVATRAQKKSSRGWKKEWWGKDNLGELWCWLSVWIWSPDDLCLQSRLALTVVSVVRARVRACMWAWEREREAQLRLSGNP